MRKTILVAAILLAVVPAALAGNYRWTGGGPEPGYILQIAFAPWNPAVVFAVVYPSGLHRSQDGGNTWSVLVEGLPATQVREIAPFHGVPNSLLAGTAEGLYRSDDAGNSWSKIGRGILESDVVAIAVSPATPQTIWIGTEGSRVFRSPDGGQTWAEAARPVGDFIWDLAVDDVTGRLYVSTPSALLWSTDGNVWTPAGEPFAFVIRTRPGVAGEVWIGTASSGVLRSVDGGQTFLPANQGIATEAVADLAVPAPADPGRPFLVATRSGIYRSANGLSWTPDPTGEEAGGVSVASDLADPTRILASTFAFGGMNRLLAKIGNGNWISSDRGLTGAKVDRVRVDPGNPDRAWALLNTSGAARFYRTEDGGETWTPLSQFGGFWEFQVHPQNADILYGVGYLDGIRRSADGGDSWETRGAGQVQGLREIALDPTDPDTLFVAGNYGGIWRSTDGGLSWTLVSSRFVQGLAVDPLNPDIVYAGGNSLERSQDGGDTWDPIPSMTDRPVSLIAIDPTNPNRVYALNAADLSFSYDRGVTWQPSFVLWNLGPWQPRSLEIDPLEPARLYFVEGVVGPGTLLRSSDYGQTWSQATAWKKYLVASNISVRGRHLWAATDRGVQRLERLYDDVDPAGPYDRFVDAVAMREATGGCTPTAFCPDSVVTRAVAAIFTMRGKHGAVWEPVLPTGEFSDVPADHYAARWIESLLRDDAIAMSCGPSLFCPEAPLSRAAAPVLLLQAIRPKGWRPRPATGVIFADVPSSHPAAAWIEEFAREGYTAGCGGGNYCPNAPVTRAQMAVMVTGVFRLQ